MPQRKNNQSKNLKPDKKTYSLNVHFRLQATNPDAAKRQALRRLKSGDFYWSLEECRDRKPIDSDKCCPHGRDWSTYCDYC